MTKDEANVIALEVFRGWTRTGVTFQAFHPNGVHKMCADLERDIVERISTALQQAALTGTNPSANKKRVSEDETPGLDCLVHGHIWKTEGNKTVCTDCGTGVEFEAPATKAEGS